MFGLFVLTLLPVEVEATIVVDHSANRTYGSFGDTRLFQTGGIIPWIETADDFVLAGATAIRHVTWWGGYYQETLPNTEEMRIRLYDTQPDNGVPGSLLFEESLLNSSRDATGFIVAILPGMSTMAAEYRFEADLAVPMLLSAGIPYWLEIAQVGDVSSQFFWRGANIEQTGRATLRGSNNWYLHPGFDMAFQLSTIPEPASLAPLLWGAGLLKRQRSR